jgi:YD repeat-containing protein
MGGLHKKHYLRAITVLAVFVQLFFAPFVHADSYTYDNLGRMTSVTYDDGSRLVYTYDPNGNVDSITSNMVATLAPDIDVTPPSHDFGDVQTGQSAAVTFDVQNLGTAALLISTVGNSNPANPPYSLVHDTCAAATLLPSQSCLIEVEFAPTAGGIVTLSLDVTSNDPDENPFLIDLSGNGLVVAVGDIDADGVIDANDRMILLGARKTCTGDAGFVPAADLNGDGCITNQDYRLWLQAYRAAAP